MQARAVLDQLKNSPHLEDASKKVKNYLGAYSPKFHHSKSVPKHEIESILSFIGGVLRQLVDRLKASVNNNSTLTLLELASFCVKFMNDYILSRTKSEKILKILFHLIVWTVTNKLQSHNRALVIHFLSLFDTHSDKYGKMISSLFLLSCSSLSTENVSITIVKNEVFILKKLAERISDLETLSHGASNAAKILLNTLTQSSMYSIIEISQDHSHSNIFVYYLNYYMALRCCMMKQSGDQLHHFLCSLLEHTLVISLSNDLHQKILYECWKMSIYVESNSSTRLYENNAILYSQVFNQYLEYNTTTGFLIKEDSIIKNSIKMLEQWYCIRDNWTDKCPSLTLSDKISKTTANHLKIIFFCRRELKLIHKTLYVDKHSSAILLEIIFNCYIDQKQYVSAFDIKCLSFTNKCHYESLNGNKVIETIDTFVKELNYSKNLDLSNIEEYCLLKFKCHILTLHNLIYDSCKFQKMGNKFKNDFSSNSENNDDGLDHLILTTIDSTKNDMETIFELFRNESDISCSNSVLIGLVADISLFLYIIVTVGLCETAFALFKQLDIFLSDLNFKNRANVDHLKVSLLHLHVVLMFEVVEIGGDLPFKPNFLFELISEDNILEFVMGKSAEIEQSDIDMILRGCCEFKDKSIDSQLDYIVRLYTLSNVIFHCPNIFVSKTYYANIKSIKSKIKICHSTQILMFTKKLVDYMFVNWQRTQDINHRGVWKDNPSNDEGTYFSCYYIRVYKMHLLMLSTVRMLGHSFCFEYGGYNESHFYCSIYSNMAFNVNSLLRVKQSKLSMKIIENWYGRQTKSTEDVLHKNKQCSCDVCQHYYQFVVPTEIDSNLTIPPFVSYRLNTTNKCGVISMENLKFIIYYPSKNMNFSTKMKLLKSISTPIWIKRYEMDLLLLNKFDNSSSENWDQILYDISALSIKINNSSKDSSTNNNTRDNYYIDLELIGNYWNNILFKQMCGWVEDNLKTVPKQLSNAEKTITFNNSFQPSFSNLLHNQQIMKLLADAFKKSTFTMDDYDQSKFVDQLSIERFSSSSYNTFIQLLPSRWKIVSMTTKNNIIHLTELRTFPTSSSGYLKIQLTNAFSYDNVLNEFSAIMEQNSQSHKITDLKKWWATRVALDTRLKKCVDSIQQEWFGCIADVLFTNNQSHYTETYNMIVENLTDSFPIEFINKWDKFIRTLIVRIVIEWAVKVCLEHIPLKRPTRSRSSRSKNPQLTDLIDDKNPVFIKLIDDLQRYFPNDSTPNMRPIIIEMINRINSCHWENELIEERFQYTTSNYPIILIVDESICMLPLESMDVCLKNKSILSRMPSLLSLANALNYHPTTINSNNTFYILNPGKDLPSTETFFKDTFESIVPSWSGLCGQIPERNQYIDALSHDIFIYCGHGNGAAYLNESNLRKLNVKGVIFIVGCSSAHLNNNGLFDHSGMILQYLASGSPCIVGNLWDVTDKDIDKFLDSTLYHWFNEDCSLPEAVTISRCTPKLKYLNGAAPVIYGIPLTTSKINYPKRFPYK